MANITRYAPQGPVALRDMFDQFFADFPWSGGWGRYFNESPMTTTNVVPGTLAETPDAFYVVLSLPGIDPQALNVTVKEQVLSVSGTHTLPMPEGARPIWRGIPEGQFHYSFTLPAPVTTDNIEARYENGLLLLSLPKVEQARSRQIQVQYAGASKQIEAGAKAQQA